MNLRRAPEWLQVLLMVIGALALTAIIVVAALAIINHGSGSNDQSTVAKSDTTAEPPAAVTSVPPTTSATTPPTTPPPKVLATFSGAANKQTALFAIEPGVTHWTVRWSMTSSSNNTIQLKQPPDDYKALVVNKIGSTADESTYYTTGSYFLNVETNAQWTITVTEFFT